MLEVPVDRRARDVEFVGDLLEGAYPPPAGAGLVVHVLGDLCLASGLMYLVPSVELDGGVIDVRFLNPVSYVEKRLKLKVNREKSVVDRATKRPLLGFGFLRRGNRITIRIDPKACKRAQDRLRRLTSRRWGISMERRIREINRFTVGWTAYFALADHPRPLRDLDEWLRRRLRQARWKQWKRYRTRRRNLVALGIPDWQARQWAATRKGYWRLAGSAPLHRAMPSAYWTSHGLRTFTDNYHRLREC